MSKKVISLSVVLGILVTALIFGGCAKWRFSNKSPEEKAEMIIDHIADELDMTVDQENKLNLIKVEVLEKFKAYKGDREVNHQKILSLIKKDTLSKADLEELALEKEKKYKELKPFVIDKIVEAHSILTKEQKDQVAEKAEKFHKKRCRH